MVRRQPGTKEDQKEVERSISGTGLTLEDIRLSFESTAPGDGNNNPGGGAGEVGTGNENDHVGGEEADQEIATGNESGQIWTEDEEIIGRFWELIAMEMPGRSAAACRNRWYAVLSKRPDNPNPDGAVT